MVQLSKRSQRHGQLLISNSKSPTGFLKRIVPKGLFSLSCLCALAFLVSFAQQQPELKTVATDTAVASVQHSYNPHPESVLSPRILLMTFVFLPPNAKINEYLRLFLESARYSGVDIAVVGNIHLESDRQKESLPPNVRLVYTTWGQLIDQIHVKLFNSSEPELASTMKDSSSFYKVMDYKPLFAFLFPEIVKDYDWWGYVDNDLVLGDIRSKLEASPNNSSSFLEQFDVICGIPNYASWGPFTMFRNIPETNKLFQSLETPWAETFLAPWPQHFDEWGGSTSRFHISVSGLVTRAASAGKIRAGNIPDGFIVWDGDCRGDKRVCEGANSSGVAGRYETDHHCFDCALSVLRVNNTPRNDLRAETHLCGTVKSRSIGLCHFQLNKKSINALLKQTNGVQQLQKRGKISLSFKYTVDTFQKRIKKEIIKPWKRWIATVKFW